MKLEKHRDTFPVFQYELGGTWKDARSSATNWTQADLAVYLTRLNYRLYLIGHMRRRATINEPSLPELVLLPVMPEDVYARDSDWHCTSYSDIPMMAATLVVSQQRVAPCLALC
eukprot:scaffold75798_cov63-Phaeocystis_antarctica.AAC.3